MSGNEVVDQVQEWWTSNPMTYGSVHGRLDYVDGEYQLGSIEFFDRVDREFYSWTKQMHSERPFDRLFPYEEYANQSRVIEVGCGLWITGTKKGVI